ncbi:hypothetical protein A6R68_17083 [Neotoma lepida]|uniref:Histone H2A n=1 Tax=Neotoma lepida TaxID=56216 RepID=A0A1A6HDX4_NEOLE|nr:hypothetical protein A6R68_17083 [Neotoma lepida]
MPRTRQDSRQGSSSCHSRTSRAKLTFSVSLVEHHLRESCHAQWLSEMARILLTANLEFLTHRLLELASNEAQHRGARRFITPELLDMTVHNNTLLSELFQNTTISQVTPAGRPPCGHQPARRLVELFSTRGSSGCSFLYGSGSTPSRTRPFRAG